MIFMSEEKYIQFIAKYNEWLAVKKLKIEEKTEPRTVMQFLAGLGNSLDNKIAENLGKTVELGKLDKVLDEIRAGKKAEDVAKILAEVSSGRVNRVVKEICEVEGLQSKEKKELQEFCKVYALKKAMKEAGLFADYSCINLNIPGMKKTMLKKTR